MNLNKLWQQQSEAAYHAWATRKSSRLPVIEQGSRAHTGTVDRLSYGDVMEWNLRDHREYTGAMQLEEHQHLKVVAHMADRAESTQELEGRMAALGHTQGTLRNLTWSGLLTARALCLLVENSGIMNHGLDTLDLTLACPVDQVTLDALASTMGQKAHTLRNLHLHCNLQFADTVGEAKALLAMLRVLSRFRGLRHLFLYDLYQPLSAEMIACLAQQSSLRVVRIAGSRTTHMAPLNDLWRVTSASAGYQERQQGRGDGEEEEKNGLEDGHHGGVAGKPLCELYVHTHTRQWGGSLALQPLKTDPLTEW
jgi:hypothetical protein